MSLALIQISYSELQLIVLILFMLLGLSALIYGGDILTKGASSISVNMRIDPMIVGLTVVSIATSMPEMATSMVAAQENPGIALGNILGSNIANIGLILGITAFFAPLKIKKHMAQKEVPFLISVSVLFIFCAYSGGLSHLEGALLLTLTIAYLLYVVKTALNNPTTESENIPLGKSDETIAQTTKIAILLVFLGAVLLGLGADVLVGASVEIASRMGASELLIGITIVAIGTSLPELAASIAAIRAGQCDMCSGNIVGSCLFNILLIGGSVSAVWGIEIGNGPTVIEFSAFLVLPCLLFWFFKSGRIVTRKEGVVLLFTYAIIISLSALSNYGYISQ